jgi:antirestriction protein ArdC
MTGYACPVWATPKQWIERGYSIKGTTTTPIVFYGKVKSKSQVDEYGKPVEFMLLRFYRVLNGEQVGFEWKPEDETLPEEITIRHKLAHEYFGKLADTIPVFHGGNHAFYRPIEHTIQSPDIEAFRSEEAYLSTIAHEYGHATGHKSLLDRNLSGRFGSKDYAAEELIAEMTSAFLMQQLGIEKQACPEHAKYINNWLTKLRDDKKYVFKAATAASKAVDCLNELVEPVQEQQAA